MDAMLHRACGHTTHSGTCSDHGTYELAGICYDCLKALIGTRIEFVRFGEAPEDGASRNHISGRGEAGVSVYLVLAGRTVIAGFPAEIWTRRPIYRGTAVMVDTGSDDEPIVDWSTVAALRKVRRAPKSA